jgi:large subunit ribosomal protein L28
MLTGKKANNGYTVSFSHKRDKHLQQANLQYKRVYWEREERWIRMRISTNAMKTIAKARELALRAARCLGAHAAASACADADANAHCHAQVGLESMAKDAGLDLYSMRFEDASESRKKWCVALVLRTRSLPQPQCAQRHCACAWFARAR